MDETIFERILAVLKMKDPDEVQAARIFVGMGEALARGDDAPLDAIQKAINKVSDATAARIFFLLLMGVLSEVGRTSHQAGKLEGQLEGFERAWTHGFDRGFLKGVKISQS